MSNVVIALERHDNLANFDAIVEQEAMPEITVLCEQGVSLAQERSPIDHGFYCNGFTSEVAVTALGVVSGRIFNTSDPVVVEVIENGRKPGRFPPMSLIQAWVQRKLAPPAPQLRNVAFLVGRAIATRGIPGKYVFRETAVALQPSIDAAGERITAKIAARL